MGEMREISRRTRELGTENAFAVLAEVVALQRQGKNILSFCIGQPDFPTPKNVCNCAENAVEEGKTGYTGSAGILELREAVAKSASKLRGVKFSADEVIIAAGAKPFIGYAVLSCTDYGKGEEIIYPNPGYPIYESQIVAHGAKPVPLHLLEEKEFRFDVEELKEKVSAKTKLLVINTPQNPTGGILKKEDLKAIADLAVDKDFWVYSDEVYSRITFDAPFESISALEGMKDRTIVVDGVSKTYSMTGWRIGYSLNRPLAKHFERWVCNTESCAAQPSQWAAVEALSGDQGEVEKMVETFRERRTIIVDGLNNIPGFKCHLPGGAFYVFPNVTEACKMVGAENAEEFRKMLLNEAEVAVLADIHFGHKNPSQGDFLRFSYAASTEQIREGLKRINDFMEKNRG